MLLAIFKKEGNARYLSQVDLQRLFQRAFRRAAFDVAYTEGFHPHVKFKTSPPPPLGVKSSAEYFVLELRAPLHPEQFIDRLNGALPTGISVSLATEIEKNPNIAGRAVSAEYRVCGAWDWERYQSVILSDGLKDEQGEEIGEKVLRVSRRGEREAVIELSYGQHNLRLDRFFGGLLLRFGEAPSLFDAEKTRLYLSDPLYGKRDADELFIS